MVERRLPKPKVAGSNPVFRSKESPLDPQTAAHRQRFFFIPPHATERETGFSPRPSTPSCGGPGRIQKARNTRADFESLRTKNQCEFEPRFPLKGNSPRTKDRSTPPAVFFYSASRTGAENGGLPKTFYSLLWRAREDTKRRGTLALILIPKGEKSVRVRTPFSAQ